MNWIHHVWFVWAWPSLKGNGPEDVLSMVGVAAVGTLIWPPTRKRIHRFFDRKHDELHRKLDHIIDWHPQIPPLPEPPDRKTGP